MSVSQDALLETAKELFIHFAPTQKGPGLKAGNDSDAAAKSQALARDFANFFHHLQKELRTGGRSQQ